MRRRRTNTSGTKIDPSIHSLSETSRRLAAEADPRQALWQLVCAVRRDLQIERVGVFAYDQFARVLEHAAGIDANGEPHFGGRSFPIDGDAHPIKQVARRERLSFYSRNVQEEYPEHLWAPGVREHAIVPIVAGDELLGALAADNCLTQKPMPEFVLEPMFLYAGLAALPLFALYQKKERDRVDRMRRSIHREVLYSVSSGKITLCEWDEIQSEWPVPAKTIPIDRDYQVRVVREAARETGVAAGMEQDRAADFGLCASEAATNALLHGHGGSACVEAREGRVRLRVMDLGEGIDPDHLPRATLQKGWSSRASLGLGFTVINETADRLFLHTAPSGTTLIIEMAVVPRADECFDLATLLWEEELAV